MAEYFKTFNSSMTKNQRTIKKTTSTTGSAYGNVLISYHGSNIYKWTFKVINATYIAIGIDEAIREDVDACFVNTKNKINYSYWGPNGKIYSNGKATKYGDKFCDKATIIMSINQNDGTLSFSNNNKKYRDIKIKQSKHGYKMCVFLTDPNEAVELLSFSCSSSNIKERNNDDTKTENDNSCSLCSKYELRIKDLEKQNNLLQNKIQKLSNDNLSNQSQIKSLKEELEETRNEKNKFERDIGKLMDEQKEIEIELKAIKDENKQLKMKHIDIKNYANWSVEEIIFWILSLEEGRYSKYENKLKSSLIEEELTGSDLIEIEESNLKMWGVVNFRDRKGLLKEIKKLTQESQNENNNNDNNMINEGAQTIYH